MLKIDLHVHTCHSYDAITTPKEAILYAKKRGLDGVAITDHDTMDGALRMMNEKDFIVIPGVEISTRFGHVLALNVATPLSEESGLSEIIRKAHDEGGIVIIPHPSIGYKAGIRYKDIKKFSTFDAIEVINSTAFPFFLWTYLSKRIATQLNIPQTAGSDSHIPWTIGTAYTLIDSEPEVEEIIRAIKRGDTDPRGEGVSWVMRVKKTFLSMKKRGGSS